VTVLALLPAFVAATDDEAKPIVTDLKAFKFSESKPDLFGYNESEEKLFYYTNGKGEAPFKVAADGDYEIVIRASGDLAQNEGAKFKVAVNGKDVGKETETSGDDRKEYKFPVTLKAGDSKLVIEFTNDVYKEGEYDRNLYVHAVSIKKVKK
jgi:hypothetical protein